MWLLIRETEIRSEGLHGAQQQACVWAWGVRVERNDGCPWRSELGLPVGRLKNWMWQCPPLIPALGGREKRISRVCHGVRVWIGHPI